MGGEYRDDTHEQCSPSELTKWVDAAIREAGYDEGHGGYSGSWYEKAGLEIKNNTFNSFEEAAEFVSDGNPKWGPLWAVKYLVAEGKPNRNLKKMEKVKDKIKELEVFLGQNFMTRATESYDAQILTRVKGGKTKFKTCPSCDSKLSVEHIKSTNCPVCNCAHILYTETDNKRIDTAAKKLETYRNDLTALEQAGKVEPKLNNSNWKWYVGGWCSC